MNIKALRDWASDTLKKTDEDFKKDKIDEKDLHNVKSYLKMIIDKCTKVIWNTQQNNNYMNDIEEYCGQLIKRKMSLPKENISMTKTGVNERDFTMDSVTTTPSTINAVTTTLKNDKDIKYDKLKEKLT